LSSSSFFVCLPVIVFVGFKIAVRRTS
jgi:hypothetical protein